MGREAQEDNMDNKKRVAQTKPLVLVSHLLCHLEERYGIYLVRTRGEGIDPNYSVCLTFWSKLPEHWEDEYFPRHFYRLIGLGHGPYDEHLPPGSGAERMPNECAAMRVAKGIGCANDPTVAKMLDLLCKRDQNLIGGQFDLAAVVKHMNKAYGDFKTQAWAEKIFSVIHERGLDAFTMNQVSGNFWNTIFAIWLVTKFAARQFPEVTKAGPLYLEQGIPKHILDGIAKTSPFDPERTLSMNIANGLLLEEDVALSSLMKFAEKRMKSNGNNPLQLHALAALMLRRGCTMQEIWDWASQALDACYLQGQRFGEGAATDFGKCTTIKMTAMRRINGSRAEPGPAIFVAAQSESSEFSTFARSKGCSIVVQTDGKSTQIATDQRAGYDLSDVIKALRVTENRMHSRPSPKDSEILAAPGTLGNCPEWYLSDHGGSIFNGTPTKQTAKSKIPFETIVELVQIGLDPNQFHPDRSEQCRAGHCTSTPEDPENRCPWEKFLLYRCRDIQWKETMAAKPRAIKPKVASEPQPDEKPSAVAPAISTAPPTPAVAPPTPAPPPAPPATAVPPPPPIEVVQPIPPPTPPPPPPVKDPPPPIDRRKILAW